MAISIDWPNGVITVPKADTTLVDIGPPEIRSYDVNAFRLELKALEDDEEAMPFDDTHLHKTITLLSGITFARVMEIINGYTVTFEDGQYSVRLTGLNHNLLDVRNANQVSLVANLTSGLVEAAATDAVWDHAQASSITVLNSRTDNL